MNGEAIKSDWLTAATPPSQEEAKAVSKTEDGRQLITETSDSGDHKTGSVENGQTADVTPPRNVVTSELTASEEIGETERPVAPSSSRETGASATAPGSGGSEVQLPARQALAVLSSVSKMI